MNLCADEHAAPRGAGVEGSENRRADPFASSLAGLEAKVLAACDGRGEWPGKVAAGVHAAVAFAAAHPGAARTLVIDFRVARKGQAHDYRRMIRRFSALLADVAPVDGNVPASTDEALVASIAAVIGHHLREGTIELAEQFVPELVYLTLMPRLGFAGARRWAASASSL